ncbi:HAD family hydrolase [Patescibacteria group bacterium]
MNFSQVKVLIWDFDGTFYVPNQKLWHEVRLAEYKTICDYTGWQLEKAKIEFAKIHKKIIPSGYMTVAKLSNINMIQAVEHIEKYFDRRKYAKRDEKLINMFEKLSRFKHYILANGSQKGIRETLKVLGVSEKNFTKIVTSEIVGVNKPDLKGFKYILAKTKLNPLSHMMIGDRVTSDLEPARKLHMATCLIGQRVESEAVDISIPVVYDIKKLFI